MRVSIDNTAIQVPDAQVDQCELLQRLRADGDDGAPVPLQLPLRAFNIWHGGLSHAADLADVMSALHVHPVDPHACMCDVLSAAAHSDCKCA